MGFSIHSERSFDKLALRTRILFADVCDKDTKVGKMHVTFWTNLASLVASRSPLITNEKSQKVFKEALFVCLAVRNGWQVSLYPREGNSTGGNNYKLSRNV